jgi:glycerol dehydrogenase-like iron-containing ADH family enzyme
MAKHIDVVYGSSIIEGHLSQLGPYIVVTIEPAWAIGAPYFHAFPPKDVIHVDTLDEDKLNIIYERLSRNGMLVGVRIVGLGGGTVLDAAKYFAYLQQTVPLLIPSITSSNAPFSDFISIRRNGGPYGFKVDGYPKKVIVDTRLLQRADPRFNRAGYGDLLYLQTTLTDWRLMDERGIGTAMDPSVAASIVELMDTTIHHAAEIGSMSEPGIQSLMELTFRSAAFYIDHLTLPIGAGSEHLFAWNMDLLTEKPLIHGEIVSLGIVIASFLQAVYLPSRHLELRQALDDAYVRYRPDDLGITWSDIESGLKSVQDYNQRVRRFHTVFELINWSPSLLKRVKDYIYG